jgi:phosphatidate cytidylyltransferase
VSAAPEIEGRAGFPATKQFDLRAAKMEWPARALFAVLLGGAALASTYAGAPYLAGVVALVTLAAAREWHRMVCPKLYFWESLCTGCAIAGGLVAIVVAPHALWPFGILGLGSAAAAISAYLRGSSPFLNGVGAIYIGVGALSIVALRDHSARGALIVVALYIVIWAADTGALITGRVIGGPKLVPVLSPNKTWAGFIGGIVLPAAGLAIYVTLLHGSGWKAAILGSLLALAAHGGDLFESWIKRRVGRKNSGSLIPGHGGVLDRIDSTLFVAPLAAVLVLALGLDPLFGGHL